MQVLNPNMFISDVWYLRIPSNYNFIGKKIQVLYYFFSGLLYMT